MSLFGPASSLWFMCTSCMSLFYPYDMLSRSAELNDLTDDAIILLMFLRQSTLSPMLLAQGVLLYEKMIIWVAKDAVRCNFCYDRCWLYVTQPLYHRKTWVYCRLIAMLGRTSGHGNGLRTAPSTQSLQSSNSRAGAQLIKLCLSLGMLISLMIDVLDLCGV